MTEPVRAQGTRDYGLAPAVRARLLGISLAALGLAVVVAAVVVTATDVPGAVLTGLVVLAVVAIAVLALLLGPRRYVVRLDETGYRLRFLRGAGRTQARWTDVADLTTAVVSGTQCVVLSTHCECCCAG